MNKSKLPSSCSRFQSITNLNKGLTDTDIELEIYEYGSDAVEIKLTNTNYKKKGSSLKMQFLYFNLCFTAYSFIIWFEIFINLFFVDIVLIIWSVFLLWRLFNLVEFEKFILCYDFGINLQVQKSFGKQNRFIPAAYIHDIVINEVIENLGFRYLLILRTKGKLFNTNPIICVFKEIKPSLECLSLVYKHINKVMRRNERYSELSEHL